MPQRWINIGVGTGAMLLLILLLAPAVHEARESARRSQVKNALKQFGLALNNYADTFNLYPPGATVNEGGSFHHSLYTRLEPFMSASPLYSQIDFNFPWDHDLNRHLFRHPTSWHLNPSVSSCSTGEGYALTHYGANPYVFFQNSSIAPDKDLSSKNLCWLISEASGNFVPYAYPAVWREWETPLCKSEKGYGLLRTKGAHFLYADRHVDYLSKDISPFVQRQLNSIPAPPPLSLTEKPQRTFTLTNQTYPWIWLNISPLRSLRILGPRVSGCSFRRIQPEATRLLSLSLMGSEQNHLRLRPSKT